MCGGWVCDVGCLECLPPWHMVLGCVPAAMCQSGARVSQGVAGVMEGERACVWHAVCCVPADTPP